MGEYKHNNGDESEVILYVDNIETLARKDPAKTMYLMGQVLLHEYFHSFYYHVGVGSRDRINCVEEPMAEYGSLVVLDSVASSGLPITTEASKTLAYTYNIVKWKQKCKGHTAAYGFGAYLYDKHKGDYRELIAEYANVSRLLDAHGRRTLEYKYMVYPTYPDPHFEGIAYANDSSKNDEIAYVVPDVPVKIPDIRNEVYLMRKILIVIDMQNDFIDAALGTKEALSIVDVVKKKILSYPTANIIATMDTHFENYMETQEGKYLPVPHCIKESDGWKIRPEIADLLAGAKVYEKPTFGSTALANDLKTLSEKEEIELELIGLCTDICVVSNALLLKAFMPEVKISVDAACCAGVTPEKHLAALETMRSCQIQISNDLR